MLTKKCPFPLNRHSMIADVPLHRLRFGFGCLIAIIFRITNLTLPTEHVLHRHVGTGTMHTSAPGHLIPPLSSPSAPLFCKEEKKIEREENTVFCKGWISGEVEYNVISEVYFVSNHTNVHMLSPHISHLICLLDTTAPLFSLFHDNV